MPDSTADPKQSSHQPKPPRDHGNPRRRWYAVSLVTTIGLAAGCGVLWYGLDGSGAGQQEVESTYCQDPNTDFIVKAFNTARVQVFLGESEADLPLYPPNSLRLTYGPAGQMVRETLLLSWYHVETDPNGTDPDTPKVIRHLDGPTPFSEEVLIGGGTRETTLLRPANPLILRGKVPDLGIETTITAGDDLLFETTYDDDMDGEPDRVETIQAGRYITVPLDAEPGEYAECTPAQLATLDATVSAIVRQAAGCGLDQESRAILYTLLLRHPIEYSCTPDVQAACTSIDVLDTRNAWESSAPLRVQVGPRFFEQSTDCGSPARALSTALLPYVPSMLLAGREEIDDVAACMELLESVLPTCIPFDSDPPPQEGPEIQFPSWDLDGDGVHEDEDNCPDVFNPFQEDLNGNGIGDVCEDDPDGDGIPREDDNCPDVHNPDQADWDGDGIGDACDDDIDGDCLDNHSEEVLQTDPRNRDTDGDGRTDGEEWYGVKFDSNCKISERRPSTNPTKIDIWTMHPEEELLAAPPPSAPNPIKPRTRLWLVNFEVQVERTLFMMLHGSVESLLTRTMVRNEHQRGSIKGKWGIYLHDDGQIYPVRILPTDTPLAVLSNHRFQITGFDYTKIQAGLVTIESISTKPRTHLIDDQLHVPLGVDAGLRGSWDPSTQAYLMQIASFHEMFVNTPDNLAVGYTSFETIVRSDEEGTQHQVSTIDVDDLAPNTWWEMLLFPFRGNHLPCGVDELGLDFPSITLAPDWILKEEYESFSVPLRAGPHLLDCRGNLTNIEYDLEAGLAVSRLERSHRVFGSAHFQPVEIVAPEQLIRSVVDEEDNLGEFLDRKVSPDDGTSGNQFVFNDLPVGELNIQHRLNASVDEDVRQWAESHVCWTTSPIGDSHSFGVRTTLSWDVPSGNWCENMSNDVGPNIGQGYQATVSFTGLPERNDDFGPKSSTAYLWTEDWAMEGLNLNSLYSSHPLSFDQVDFEVFFARHATNHPRHYTLDSGEPVELAIPFEAGECAGTNGVPADEKSGIPNWVYYWMQELRYVDGTPAYLPERKGGKWYPQVLYSSEVQHPRSPSPLGDGDEQTGPIEDLGFIYGRHMKTSYWECFEGTGEQRLIFEKAHEGRGIPGITNFAMTMLHESMHASQWHCNNECGKNAVRRESMLLYTRDGPVWRDDDGSLWNSWYANAHLARGGFCPERLDADDGSLYQLDYGNNRYGCNGTGCMVYEYIRDGDLVELDRDDDGMCDQASLSITESFRKPFWRPRAPFCSQKPGSPCLARLYDRSDLSVPVDRDVCDSDLDSVYDWENKAPVQLSIPLFEYCDADWASPGMQHKDPRWMRSDRKCVSPLIGDDFD